MAAWLERAIAAVSPATALQREQSRQQMSAMREARNLYEGATLGRRGASFKRSQKDINSELRGDLHRLREGSRDLIRNNAYAARGVQAITHNMIGTGIIPQSRARTQTAQGTSERLAREHLDTTAIDAAGRHDLYGLEALVARTVVESGECIIRRRRRRMSDGLPLPFQLQVLEPDFLDSNRDGPEEGQNYSIQGVQFDALGRVMGYWLYDQHPGSTNVRSAPHFRSNFVPAEDVAHVFRTDRAGQVRGVPWLAPVLLRLRDLADYEDAQLIRQKIAACFAAFVTDVEGATPTAGDKDGNNPNLQESLEPGIMEYLPPGKDIRFASPPPADGYKEHLTAQLQAIAAGLGVSYEALTGDLSEVNFSSARMGWLEFQRNIEAWRWHFFAPQFLRRVERWFFEAANMQGTLSDRRVSFSWTPPRREMIDPTKEVPANRDAVRSGQLTLSELIRQNGHDPDEHFTEYASDMARIEQLGLTLDSDPRRVDRNGNAHTQLPAESLNGDDNASAESD
jgi:lambda family phage portal protein